MTVALALVAAIAFVGSAHLFGRYLATRHVGQQQLDEHTDWLGADAGGSFYHHEGASK